MACAAVVFNTCSETLKGVGGLFGGIGVGAAGLVGGAERLATLAQLLMVWLVQCLLLPALWVLDLVAVVRKL